MMEQTFEYPNLLSGTRSGEGWKYEGPAGGGAVSYDKENNYLALHGTPKSEFFMNSPIVVLHKGIDYTLHCLAANTANMSGTELWVLDGTGASDSYNWIGAHVALKTPGAVGAWLDATFRLMVTLNGDGVPHAWAPADGEVWP